jgi:hypothetical protein
MPELQGPSSPSLQNRAPMSRFHSRLSRRFLRGLTRPCRRAIQNRCHFLFQARRTRVRHALSFEPSNPFYNAAVYWTTGVRQPQEVIYPQRPPPVLDARSISKMTDAPLAESMGKCFPTASEKPGYERSYGLI